jgi:hypothetical protein
MMSMMPTMIQMMIATIISANPRAPHPVIHESAPDAMPPVTPHVPAAQVPDAPPVPEQQSIPEDPALFPIIPPVDPHVHLSPAAQPPPLVPQSQFDPHEQALPLPQLQVSDPDFIIPEPIISPLPAAVFVPAGCESDVAAKTLRGISRATRRTITKNFDIQ